MTSAFGRYQHCVFCDLIHDGRCERVATGDVTGVYRLAPLNPVAEGHMLFLPQTHVISAAIEPNVTADVFRAAAAYGAHGPHPFNLITSVGEWATQTVQHLHVHYVPRRKDDGLKLPWSA